MNNKADNKRPAEPAGASPRKAKINLFKRETDDEDSVAVLSPPALSDRAYYRKETYDDEGERSSPTTSHAATASAAAITTVTTTTKQPIIIITFVADNDKFARLQLLSTHTLYDLVSTLCRHTPVGYEGGEGPDDHLWNINYGGYGYESVHYDVRSPSRAEKTTLADLQLTMGCVLYLIYDYGTTHTYQITVVETEGLKDETNMASLFPRNHQPMPGIPASYQNYQPNITAGMTRSCNNNLLDVDFFHLNDWIFHNKEKTSSVTVHLFQAGRKKNYGFMDNTFTMMYLPTKPDNLANWLECFNQGARIKPAGVVDEGYKHYTWQSVVPLPRSKLTQHLRDKYASNERRGFCDAPIVEDHSYYYNMMSANNSSSVVGEVNNESSLEKIFPKIAALAGLKKDKHVPKGWISFAIKHGGGGGGGDRHQCSSSCSSLTVCRGNAQEPKKSKKAQVGLAFEGEDQHCPVEEPLFQISGGVMLDNIRGLHDLFCVVEGLLRTLG